ncbi:hypothetical protein APUTEX25_005812 [Auxenochlorella protothecoides]|uniref:Zinc transporter ZupT n=1 Tax=Auxenochlorella protothecoides TaxID=3075 RepID=A0A3M7KZ65_AUXPR|nr:hypothetical protein APUTEX25_005812 [Auxenochlorella protothecoides]|eukprot:RMZ55771.1 hypothetical protein APUTEX25_005812 [Auxenochlorella protothecoides]
MFSEEERWALLLSTFAGMSTTLGAALAIIRPPDDALLSFLLGTAIGVMMLLSVVEMPQSPRELLRLGLLMAGTMTLHNLPEGAAVAFSSFTPLGPLMALAIAVHNVPEGVIVAAPVYAATGPLGALLVICVARPALTATRLQLMLAGVGGLMAAVCVLELWPEARRCRAGGRLAAGIALGAGLMAWTLWLGV